MSTKKLQIIGNIGSGSSVNIDKTLTQSGQAADAQVVGTALANMYSKAEVDNAIANVEIEVSQTISETGTNAVSGSAVASYVTQKVADVEIEVSQTVTDGDTNAVSGEAVVNYVAQEISNAEVPAHNQSASTITAGTFAGAVVAPRSSQTTSTYMLRNSRLASSDTDPYYNGEICWTYG